MFELKGIITRQSDLSVSETINRFIEVLQKKGTTIYARIDQQAELHSAGFYIKPIEFILFGNPVAGGATIAAMPVAALDLPLKILCWEDNSGKTWVAYNDYRYIEQRYHLDHKENSPLKLDTLVDAVLGG